MYIALLKLWRQILERHGWNISQCVILGLYKLEALLIIYFKVLVIHCENGINVIFYG